WRLAALSPRPGWCGARGQDRRSGRSAENIQGACRPVPYAVLAATSSSMRAHRLLRTKYCSVVALPSLTSWVHCSSGILMPNALSIAKATSRKSRLSIPRSSVAWLSGLMVSRGMSQVSAMILATVSKVDDIVRSPADESRSSVQPSVCKALPCPRAKPPWQLQPKVRHSEEGGGVQWQGCRAVGPLQQPSFRYVSALFRTFPRKRESSSRARGIQGRFSPSFARGRLSPREIGDERVWRVADA